MGQLELVAAVVAYLTFPDVPSLVLAGKLWHHFIDNEGAYYSLMSGYSGKADCALVIHEYHLQILRLKCYPWLGFVYSGDNISDLPSRNEFGLVQRLGATFRTAGLCLIWLVGIKPWFECGPTSIVTPKGSHNSKGK